MEDLINVDPQYQEATRLAMDQARAGAALDAKYERIATAARKLGELPVLPAHQILGATGLAKSALLLEKTNAPDAQQMAHDALHELGEQLAPQNN